MPQKKKGHPVARQLLELHIQHELAAFSPDTFITWARDETGLLFDWLKTLPLNDLVTARQIKTVIQTNVVEQDVPGAIAEIAGEAATSLFTSELHKNTLLKDVMSRKRFEEFVEKLIELEEQRQEGLDKIIDLPLYGELISGVLYQAMTRYIYESNVLSKNIPGVASMLKMSKNVFNKAAPKLGNGLEDSIKSYIAGSLEFFLDESKSFLRDSVTDEQLQASAMELWSMIEDKTLGEFQQGMDSLDLSEFIAIGYEFWLNFRKTTYFKNSYETVVDYFFDKYGPQTLSNLFDDLMITPERAVRELELFAPEILEKLKESGQLEALIRRRLEGFYHSKAALNCLNNRA